MIPVNIIESSILGQHCDSFNYSLCEETKTVIINDKTNTDHARMKAVAVLKVDLANKLCFHGYSLIDGGQRVVPDSIWLPRWFAFNVADLAAHKDHGPWITSAIAKIATLRLQGYDRSACEKTVSFLDRVSREMEQALVFGPRSKILLDGCMNSAWLSRDCHNVYLMLNDDDDLSLTRLARLGAGMEIYEMSECPEVNVLNEITTWLYSQFGVVKPADSFTNPLT